MNKRMCALAMTVTGAVLLLGSASAQRSSGAALTYPDGSPLPLTEWGDPDLQGMWPIMHLFTTPLQRPPQLGEREIRTEEEIAQAQASMERRDASYHQMVQSNQLGMGGWAESTTTVDAIALTSLTSYPRDGRFPGLTARGEELRPFFGSDDTRTVFDSPTEDFDQWDRCITRGLPMSMLPFNYNNGIRIIQSPGFVVIDLEMIHESRIIPVDGRPPLDSEIKQWLGEPRGYWDGATLVVETMNFNGESNMTIAGVPGGVSGDTPTTAGMKTTERLTRVSDNRINYEMTIEDPEILNDKWTIRYPMILDPTYQFFEYACHEDNTAVRNFIETSRYERANPEEFAQPAGGRGGFGGGGGRGFGGGRRGGGPGDGQ
jgi:hypothetical protein